MFIKPAAMRSIQQSSAIRKFQVFPGAEHPLKRPHVSASWFHGRDGLGDHGYPPPRRSSEKQPAVDAIIDTIEAHPGLVLVTLGPLTNIALALQRSPASPRT